MNVIDKAISIFDPQTALKRQVARAKLDIIAKGYSQHGASRTDKALKEWPTDSGNVDEDIHDNLDILVKRSRDLYYGANIGTGAIKSTRTNVIGSGLKCKPKIDKTVLNLTDEEALKWNEKTEKEFALWGDSVHCDAQRMNNFGEIQQLAFVTWLVEGDTFALLPYIPRKQLPYDLRVQLIEPSRVSNPSFIGRGGKDKNVKRGVIRGKHGEVVAYYIANREGEGYDRTIKHKKIWKYGKESGRTNVVHAMESERVGQVRGLPFLTPVIKSIKQLTRYTNAEITAAVIAAYFTVFIENKSMDSGGALGSEGGNGEFYEEADQDTGDNSSEQAEYKLGSGAIIELEEGQTVKDVNPGRQNSSFDAFIKSMCNQIGAALEIPSDILLKAFNKSYSASRAAMLEAWKMYKMRRTWMANDFCQPIYEEFLTEAITKGRIKAPGFFRDPLIRKAYCNAEWIGPSPGQIDPVKEVNAAIKRVDNGFTTREQETTALNGGSFRDNIEAAKWETQQMKESGLKEEVNAEKVLGN